MKVCASAALPALPGGRVQWLCSRWRWHLGRHRAVLDGKVLAEWP